jgi:serine/threonine protein kinase
MATRQDLDLAKRLLAARVVSHDQIRRALEVQGEWLQKKNVATLEQALYALGAVPKDALAPLRGPDPMASQPFRNYRLDRVLGEGGAAVVYGGTYLPNGTPVAVKVLDPVHALRREYVDRFHVEAQLLAELDHENIVAGYEHGTEKGRHFYSMDVVEGATVLEVIERRGRLTNVEALSITLQIARALDHVHRRGLLHRDLKPGNVMVESYGRVRLIDLGLARTVAKPDSGGEEEGTTVGTVEYLSPEQARGRTDLDPRTDVYSLGLTLYHMVVGEVPFQGESDYEVMAKQVMASLDAQKLKHRHVTPEIYFFIVKMTSKDREDRYETAAEAVEEIAGYLPPGLLPIDLGVAPPAVAPVVRPTVPPPRRFESPTRRPEPPPPRRTDAPTSRPEAPTPRRADPPARRPDPPAPRRGEGRSEGRPEGRDEPPSPRRRFGR